MVSLLFGIKNKKNSVLQFLSLGWFILVNEIDAWAEERQEHTSAACVQFDRSDADCGTGLCASFEIWTKLFLISSCNEFSPFWYSD